MSAGAPAAPQATVEPLDWELAVRVARRVSQHATLCRAGFAGRGMTFASST